MLTGGQVRMKMLAVGMSAVLLMNCAVPAVYAGEIHNSPENVTVNAQETVTEQEHSKTLVIEAETSDVSENFVSGEETKAAADDISTVKEMPDATVDTSAGEIRSDVSEDSSAGGERSEDSSEGEQTQDRSESSSAEEEMPLTIEDSTAEQKDTAADSGSDSVQEPTGESGTRTSNETDVSEQGIAYETMVGASSPEDIVKANAQRDLTASRGVYYYGSKEDKADMPDTYIYDDGLLRGNSRPYNEKLATMSLSLVNASIGSIRAEIPEKSQNLCAFLEDNGFMDFEANKDYQSVPTLETMGVACAHKKITDGGKTYTLLVIAPRSAGYKTEWGGNFDVGTSGDHEGFTHAKDIVLSFAREYIQKYGITGDIKVWTAGGSRGAGVINLVGADLLRAPDALGDSVVLSPENLYCYTFGTPKAADSTSEDYQANNESKYGYIHNLSDPSDVVGTFAPLGLGFDRYGETSNYVDPELKDDMLVFLRATSEAMYDKFTKGGDPDRFIPLQVNLKQLIAEKKLALTPETEGYLADMKQADYMRLLEGSMLEAFESRENYVANYEAPLEHFFGYLYGGSGEMGPLFQGIKESDYMFPTIASMYISLVLEQYIKSESTAPEVITDLKSALSELENAVDEMNNNGMVMPADFETRFNMLKEQLNKAETQQKINELAVNTSWSIAADFYSKAMKTGLEPLTSLGEEEKNLLTSEQDSRAMTKFLSYMLLIDPAQEQKFGFEQLGDQFIHLATTIGNAGSFMTPHYNEVILAWLRAEDPNYQDFQKANSAQATGYRRVFVEQPQGVTLKGTVRDSDGNVAAIFENGKLLYSADNWIGMTTSDSGNWLRLPIDMTYTIEFAVSEDTTINIRVSEYSVAEGKEVRVETNDSKYDWKDFSLRVVDSASLVVSAINGQEDKYKLNSGAAYYLDMLKRFIVTYMLNGGSLNGTKDTVTVVYDDGTVLELPTPYREGYRFSYWEGSKYYAGDLFTVFGDHKFRAVWEKNPEDKPAKPEENTGEEQKSASPEIRTVSYPKVKADNDTVKVAAQRVRAVETGDQAYPELWILVMVLSLLSAVYMKRRTTYR